MFAMGRTWRGYALSMLIVILSACGGGGGGGGGSSSSGGGNGGNTGGNPPPSSSADVPNSYLPTDPSVRWMYNGGAQLNFLPDDTSTGIHIHGLLYPTGGKEYFVTAANQINLQGLYLPSINVGDGINYNGDIRFNNLLAVFGNDWLAGTSRSVNGAGTINIMPTYGKRAVNFSGTVYYVGDEAISTALGSFVAKRVNIDLTLNTVVDGYSFSIPYNVTFWFAKDIGIVRREQGNVIYLLSSVTGINLNNTGGSSNGNGSNGDGSNGGGDTNGSGGGAFVDGANSFFPTNNSIAWFYDNSYSEYGLFTSATFDGIPTHVWSNNYDSAGRNYYATTASQVSLKGFDYFFFVSGISSTVKAEVLLPELAPLFRNDWSGPQNGSISGTAHAQLYRTFGWGSALPSIELPYTGTLTYYGDETLAVAGRNLSTKHVLLQLDMDTEIYGQHYDVGLAVELWLADHVGIVKRGTHILTAVDGINYDGDADGVSDFFDDAFPNNPAESVDTDGDGIGDNADTDDDGDGYPDISDAYPLDPQRWLRMYVQQSALSFGAVFGSSATTSSQTLSVSGANPHWQAASSSGWLTLNKNSGVGDDTISVTVDSSGMADGSYQGSITFTETTTNQQLVVPVTLTVALPTLSADVSAVNFDASYGWDDIGTQTVAVSLNTGANSYAVSRSLTFTPSGGVSTAMSNNSVSSTSKPLSVSIDPKKFTSGSYSGQISLTANVNGKTVSKSIPLSVKASEHILYASDDGVALSSFPTVHKLSQTIAVRDSYSLTDTPWSATVDQSWLSVTPSGDTSQSLVITADPSALAVDTVHYATISISSSDTHIGNTAKVRVALWVGSSDPQALTTLPSSYKRVVADPIRPYIYAERTSGQIDIYNIFNRASIGTITGLGTEIGEMHISSDGSYLFALDVTNNSIVRINLDDPTQKAQWAFPTDPVGLYDWRIFTVARPAGHSVVVLDTGTYLDAGTGAELATNGFSPHYSGAIEPSADGRRLCRINTGISPFTIGCSGISYSSLGGGSVSTKSYGTDNPWGIGSNGKDIALSEDGSLLYAAAGGYYAFLIYDLPSISFSHNLAGDAYPNNVELSSDGSLFASTTGYGKVWVYNTDGSLRKQLTPSGNPLDRQLTVSGDGLMAAILTDNSQIVFMSGY